MKEVTKTVNQYEIGDYVMLVKDTKFGGPTRNTVVRVTGTQAADGFFTGDVITGSFHGGERFHWANVRLLTTKEVEKNKKRFIKNLNLVKSDIAVSYENKHVYLEDDLNIIEMSIADAKLFATFVTNL